MGHSRRIKRKNMVSPQQRQATQSLYEIYVRRMTVEEALRKLDQDLHDAFVANMYQVRVVHGKGTGILKNAVQEYLSHSSLVSSYRLAGYGEGGGGVTIVDLAPE